MLKEEIPFLYPNNLHNVKFNQDKAPRHASKPTALFLEKNRNETRIEDILFKCIPLKSQNFF